MNTKTLNILIVAALIALIAAVALNVSKKPQSEGSESVQFFLPQLREHLNDVSGVTLVGAGDKTIATLKRGDAGWSLAEKSNYPVDIAKLREFLLKLSEASVIEAKTANKDKYADLGVSDIKDADAKGVLVTIDGLATPIKLIVGNYNGSGGGGTFMRRDGEAQSYLVRGNISADKTLTNWLKKELTDIQPSRFKEVTINNPDGKLLKAIKEMQTDTNFKLVDVPKDREPSSDFVANSLPSVLAGLRFEDVMPANDAQPADKVYKDHYALFDGVTIDAVAWEKEGKAYARFSAALDTAQANAHIKSLQDKAKAEYDAKQAAANSAAFEAKPTTGADTEPAKSATAQKDSNAEAAARAASEVAKPLAVSDPDKDRDDTLAALNKEVAGLNHLFEGWTFVLPNHKFAGMNKTMDDMLKPLESKKSDAKTLEGKEVKKAEIKTPQTKPLK